MDSAQLNWKLLVGVTTLVLYSRPMNIVAILETVGQQIIPDFSKIGARVLIVTLRMMQQAHLLAMVGLTIRWCSALEEELCFRIWSIELVASMQIRGVSNNQCSEAFWAYVISVAQTLWNVFTLMYVVLKYLRSLCQKTIIIKYLYEILKNLTFISHNLLNVCFYLLFFFFGWIIILFFSLT